MDKKDHKHSCAECDIKLKKAEEQLQKVLAEKAELENSWKRALADYQNLKKRTEEEKDAMGEFASYLIISRFLSVLDNLEMLNAHLDDMGLKMIVKEFKQILAEEGLQEIEVENKEFDPQIMEAVEAVEGEPNRVVKVSQKGYKIKQKLVRPAKVVVGKKEE